MNDKFLVEMPVGKLMKKYSIPCIISLLVAALYNIVDQIFISNASYLGSYGNAANTVVYPLTIVALAIAVFIGDGACAYVSIALGAGRKEDAHKTIGSAIINCVIISAVLTAIYLIFADQIITAFGGRVNEGTFTNAKEYFFWISVGVPFYMFGQCLNPIIRSDGSPKFAMATTLVGALINIILDPVFIFICKWGMMGAAVATILGQIVTAIAAIYYCFHMKLVKLSKKSFNFYFDLMKQYLPLGITSFLSQISLVFSMMAVNNMISKYSALDVIFSQAEYAQIPMAVVGIVMKFFQIVISIAVGMAAGCIPVVGYNIGAGRKDRAWELFKLLIRYELLVGFVGLVCVEIFPKAIINIFGAANESVYYTEFALKSFRIYLCLMPLATLNKGIFIYLQSLGKAKESTMISMVREIVFGVGFALLLPIFFGLNGVLYSMPVSDLLTFVIAMIIVRNIKTELTADTVASETAEEKPNSIQSSKEGVIITIAREHGTDGKGIGKALADKLGIPFYDKELTMLFAKETGLSKQYFNDEKDDEMLAKLYSSKELVANSVKAQNEIINKIADNGACVICGRAANYFLRNRNIVSIFLYASEEYKIKNITVIYGDNETKARKAIRMSDEARSRYYEEVTGQKWNDVHNYDLCLKTDLGTDKTVDKILQYING